ncbi:hypothetical protein KSC_102040 [Ktedonobacter sp. SOSP1-52]|nr:hypothetical protein KSC_102040 [Ktedonobacter sp. SOSP1-52]
MLKLRQILATAILELTAFERIPDPFLGIELGCIGRQTGCVAKSQEEKQRQD